MGTFDFADHQDQILECLIDYLSRTPDFGISTYDLIQLERVNSSFRRQLLQDNRIYKTILARCYPSLFKNGVFENKVDAGEGSKHRLWCLQCIERDHENVGSKYLQWHDESALLLENIMASLQKAIVDGTDDRSIYEAVYGIFNLDQSRNGKLRGTSQGGQPAFMSKLETFSIHHLRKIYWDHISRAFSHPGYDNIAVYNSHYLIKWINSNPLISMADCKDGWNITKYLEAWRVAMHSSSNFRSETDEHALDVDPLLQDTFDQCMKNALRTLDERIESFIAYVH